jgi:hypothetical protein
MCGSRFWKSFRIWDSPVPVHTSRIKIRPWSTGGKLQSCSILHRQALEQLIDSELTISASRIREDGPCKKEAVPWCPESPAVLRVSDWAGFRSQRSVLRVMGEEPSTRERRCIRLRPRTRSGCKNRRCLLPGDWSLPLRENRFAKSHDLNPRILGKMKSEQY